MIALCRHIVRPVIPKRQMVPGQFNTSEGRRSDHGKWRDAAPVRLDEGPRCDIPRSLLLNSWKGVAMPDLLPGFTDVEPSVEAEFMEAEFA